MIIDRDIIIARNPENELDATWFSSEKDAYEHFCDYGEDYIYTALNEAEGWSLSLNEDFAERRDRARSTCRFDLDASRADRQNDERMEMAI